MAQHMTTTELIRSRTLQEQFTAALTDLVLVDHGTGSKRHRAFTLAEIAALIAGGSLNPIVLEGSGGGQNFTLTITHNSITCVKSATGGASVTTKIDFNDESILPTVKADTIKAKTLHGTTVEGLTNKLVIDTITEILGNLVIGSSDAKKNVTIHGDLDLDGRFSSDVFIGGNGRGEGKNLDVRGNVNCKNLTVVAKVYHAAFNVSTNVLDINTDSSLIGFDDDEYEQYDILMVHNTSSHASKVYCGYDDGPLYVEIKPYCTIPFHCLFAGHNNWQWSPLANVDVEVVSQQN